MNQKVGLRIVTGRRREEKGRRVLPARGRTGRGGEDRDGRGFSVPRARRNASYQEADAIRQGREGREQLIVEIRRWEEGAAIILGDPRSFRRVEGGEKGDRDEHEPAEQHNPG